MTDLAAQTGTSTSGITSIVDRLQAAGLTDRTPDPADRRASVVQLTDAGVTRLTSDLSDLISVIDANLTTALGRHRTSFERNLRQIRALVAPNAAQISSTA